MQAPRLSPKNKSQARTAEFLRRTKPDLANINLTAYTCLAGEFVVLQK
jgi:hypothetical protein